MIRFGVVWDVGGWHEKFRDAVATKKREGLDLESEILRFDDAMWQERAEQCDVILWNPGYMGPRIASLFKERVYFLQEHLGKLVVPNFQTVWHYESKISQSFLFARYDVPTPRTFVTSSYAAARDELRRSEFPLVFKKSHGASSRNVRLIRTQSTALKVVSRIFCQQLWDEAKHSRQSPFLAAVASLPHSWFWAKAVQRILGRERFGLAYWQEFIPGNDADLRLAVFGDRYVAGFWRRNRPHDFRASGSGRIDYERPIPEGAIRLCVGISKRLGFDSMAYDLLLRNGSFVVTEMSYSFIDTALFDAAGHYEIDEQGAIRFIPGHRWPQEFWVTWALLRHSRPGTAASSVLQSAEQKS